MRHLCRFGGGDRAQAVKVCAQIGRPPSAAPGNQTYGRTEDEASVIQRIHPQPSPENRRKRNRWVLRHLPLVRYIASRMRPTNGHVDAEDLLSAGTIALIEAVDRFDPERGVAFATFAYPRIKGAIVDEMYTLASSARDRAEVTLIDVTVDRSIPEPHTSAELSELLEAVRELPPRERELVALSAAGNSLGEIAEFWGCSESRVSQLLVRARFRLEERTAA